MVRLAISERRDLLIAAAWRVMARDGVAAATTRAICAEAEMPQSSFHYCFDTRADLLRIVVTSRLPEHLKVSIEALEQGRTPDERIRLALDTWWQDVVAHPESHAVMFDITMHSYYDPDLRDLAAFQYAAAHEAILTLLAHVVADDQFSWDTDPQQLAVWIIAFLDGIALRYIADPRNASFKAVQDAFTNNLAAHLRPTTAATTV